MPRTTLEQRVAVLEEQMRTLLADKASDPPQDLRSIHGAFTGDDLMKLIFEEGRKIREAERKRARRQNGKARKTRS